MTGLSRAQVTRLIGRYVGTGRVARPAAQRHRFPRRYTSADVELLAAVDQAHECLSGPATRHILAREFHLYQRPGFERLASISNGHLYNLRQRPRYRERLRHYQKTRPAAVSIGERRKPEARGQPGFLRMDTVHQGDRPEQKGIYHINAVDEVTQWEVVLATPRISEAYLLPVLESLLAQFPFQIQGFHSDNGSEFINQSVARLRHKLHIEQTKSRPRRSDSHPRLSHPGESLRRTESVYRAPAALVGGRACWWHQTSANHPAAEDRHPLRPRVSRQAARGDRARIRLRVRGLQLPQPDRDRQAHHRLPVVWPSLLWLEAQGKQGSCMSHRIRCAIYTRKSSEEGLEQSFNSLDAQREACEAYIKSQQQEGWQRIPTRYDDGGFSGGNIERPALKQLMADIQAGKVNVVVVYKVDRLTRSLADFAKIIEQFDKFGVSFVSITQQFNTTSSMGRLTLNVLLSFAQFEREVTGERIRDKIAASKKKGMWMGGTVPLGYAAVTSLTGRPNKLPAAISLLAQSPRFSSD